MLEGARPTGPQTRARVRNAKEGKCEIGYATAPTLCKPTPSSPHLCLEGPNTAKKKKQQTNDDITIPFKMLKRHQVEGG